MSDDNWKRVKHVFQGAIACAPESQAAYLDRTCGTNAALRAEVEALLSSDRCGDPFLVPPTSGSGSPLTASVDDKLAGTRVGRYALTRLIAAGGMGAVYEAWQDQPHRQVAVKIMRYRLASPFAQRRFADEAQILARLQHAHVAQVYEAGTHADAGSVLPYIAMEYVPDARALTDYAAERGLDLRARLRIFLQVCDAVDHGHQRGVIHRDLKPANLLVDGGGQTKIIDFGVARIVDPVGGPSDLTQTGQLIGTLPYLSPEQCLADPRDLDTRSDVYALGVVLYELLCGRLPYDLAGLPPDEAVHRIRQGAPVPPSRVSRALRGDVETILLKALEKERQRRYQSVAELSRDIQRYLAGRAIEARAGSRWYVARKTLKRHWLPASLVATLVVCATAAAVAMTILYRNQIRLYRQAEREAQNALAARDQAALAEHQQRLERARAEAVLTFLQDALLAASPFNSGRRDTTLREMLDQASKQLVDGTFDQQPGVAAGIHQIVGRTYYGLGLYAAAEAHQRSALELSRRAWGERHTNVAACLSELGLTCHNQARYEEAATLTRQALALQRELLGAEHREVAKCLSNLSSVLQTWGRLPEAESTCRDALALYRRLLGDEHREVARNLSNLALIVQRRGRLPEAESLTREALALRRKLLGNEHPEVANGLNNLGTLLIDQRNFEGAETALREALAIRTRVMGPEHPDTARTMSNLGSTLRELGRLDEAEQTLREALALRRQALGDAHPEVASTLSRLATLYAEQQRWEEAEPLLRETLDVRRRTLGETHTLVAYTVHNLAYVLTGLGKAQAAESLCRESLAVKDRATDDPEWAMVQVTLASLLAAQGAHAEAEGLFRQSLPAIRRTPSTDTRIAEYESGYGASLAALGCPEEAEPLLLGAYERLATRFGEADARTQRALQAITALYEAWNRPDRATEYRERLLAGTAARGSNQ